MAKKTKNTKANDAATVEETVVKNKKVEKVAPENNQEDAEEEKEYSILNLGPTHPATHGIFQNVLKMDGEIIHEATPTVGYIHRAFEK